MSVLVRMPSNGACVRRMQIIGCVTSYIVWGAKTRWFITMCRHLSSHISSVPRPIFEVERPIERSLSPLHVTASHNAVKLRMRPSNAKHCLCDVIHTWRSGFVACGPYPNLDLSATGLSLFPQPLLKQKCAPHERCP